MLGVDNTFRGLPTVLVQESFAQFLKLFCRLQCRVFFQDNFGNRQNSGRNGGADLYAGTVPEAATKLTSSSRTISVHLYCLLNEGLYTEQAYATAVVLIVFVVIINALSNALAKKIMK